MIRRWRDHDNTVISILHDKHPPAPVFAVSHGIAGAHGKPVGRMKPTCKRPRRRQWVRSAPPPGHGRGLGADSNPLPEQRATYADPHRGTVPRHLLEAEDIVEVFVQPPVCRDTPWANRRKSLSFATARFAAPSSGRARNFRFGASREQLSGEKFRDKYATDWGSFREKSLGH
jgi:hypothetical protein